MRARVLSLLQGLLLLLVEFLLLLLQLLHLLVLMVVSQGHPVGAGHGRLAVGLVVGVVMPTSPKYPRRGIVGLAAVGDQACFT